jgi:hypothetical protein
MRKVTMVKNFLAILIIVSFFIAAHGMEHPDKKSGMSSPHGRDPHTPQPPTLQSVDNRSAGTNTEEDQSPTDALKAPVIMTHDEYSKLMSTMECYVILSQGDIFTPWTGPHRQNQQENPASFQKIP